MKSPGGIAGGGEWLLCEINTHVWKYKFLTFIKAYIGNILQYVVTIWFIGVYLFKIRLALTYIITVSNKIFSNEQYIYIYTIVFVLFQEYYFLEKKFDL